MTQSTPNKLMLRYGRPQIWKEGETHVHVEPFNGALFHVQFRGEDLRPCPADRAAALPDGWGPVCAYLFLAVSPDGVKHVRGLAPSPMFDLVRLLGLHPEHKGPIDLHDLETTPRVQAALVGDTPLSILVARTGLTMHDTAYKVALS